jgi:hypothetical protein
LASKSLGPFPKSIHWREFFPPSRRHLSDVSLALLQERYDLMAEDVAALRAITFLVALVVCTRAENPFEELHRFFGITIDGMASRDEILNSLNTYLPVDHPAKAAAKRTILRIYEKDLESLTLFHTDPWRVWRSYDGSPFCDLARLFYSHLNSECFATMLSECSVAYDPDDLAQFAWESSVITRAFSARWFNACARYEMPEQGSIKWYLGHCLGKVELEIARESSDWVEPLGNPWRRRKIAMPALQM